MQRKFWSYIVSWLSMYKFYCNYYGGSTIEQKKINAIVMSLFSRFSYYIDALYKIQASLCQCLFDQSKQQTYVKLLANLISFSFLIRKIIEFFLLYYFPSTFSYLFNWAYWIINKISTIHVRNLLRIFDCDGCKTYTWLLVYIY